MKRRPTPSARTVAVAAAMALAMLGGGVTYASDAWPRLENDSVDLRFALRAPQRPADLVVVAIDDKTFSDLQVQWPFPRRLHAQVISRLRADGATAIAYDAQFTEPTDERDDLALFESIRSAGRVVLATTEVDSAGRTNVLGGDANLTRAHAVAAAANLPADAGGVIRRYPYSLLGIDSLAVATAKMAGSAVTTADFAKNGALIDFRGPPGTIATVSFSDVLRGRVPAKTFAGKIVVVGATAPTLQDVHPTSTTAAAPMAGPEIQANAIWTALNHNPLRAAPGWLAWVAIVLAGIIAPMAALRFRVLMSAGIAGSLAAVYLVLAQVSFDSGAVLVLTYPLAAWLIGTVGMVAANYVGAFVERNAFARQLRASQLELIQRLAQAVETRDTETGEHVQRIGRLCRALALEIGWSSAEADRIQHASAMHDIGKIGVPDSILLKPGKLTAQEWEVIRGHAAVGAGMLSGSSNPLLQMAEEIARSHHERWDGAGYPDGLSGTKIPIAARICAVVDVYDALLSRRHYKEAWTMEQTLAEIERESGKHFDPDLVGAFVKLAPHLQDEIESASVAARTAVPRPATA